MVLKTDYASLFIIYHSKYKYQHTGVISEMLSCTVPSVVNDSSRLRYWNEKGTRMTKAWPVHAIPLRMLYILWFSRKPAQRKGEETLLTHLVIEKWHFEIIWPESATLKNFSLQK